MLYAIDGVVDFLHPNQGLNDLKNAGMTQLYLDLTSFYNWYDAKKGEEIWNEKHQQICMVADLAREKGLEIVAVKMPAMNYMGLAANHMLIEDTMFGRADFQKRLAVEMVKLVEEIKCPYLILEPLEQEGVSLGCEDGESTDELLEYYRDIASRCNNADTKLLIFNKCRVVGGHKVRSNFSDGRFLAQYVECLNQALNQEKRFGILLDIGQCNLCGQNVSTWLTDIGKEPDMVLIRENNGVDNISALPFTIMDESGCTQDWLSCICGLRDVRKKGLLALDFASTVKNVPILLKPALLETARKIGDYVIWQIQMTKELEQYGSLVLFGAGNMCRVFMRNYGNQFQVLYTCDNNPKLWGTTVEGLEVKNPGILRQLPEDCAVVICNMYYRDITQQLNRLGISNVIYFSDEYIG